MNNYDAMPTAKKFEYLARKIGQYVNDVDDTGANVDKLVKCWMRLIKLPFEEAPKQFLPIYKLAKDRIKKELLL